MKVYSPREAYQAIADAVSLDTEQDNMGQLVIYSGVFRWRDGSLRNEPDPSIYPGTRQYLQDIDPAACIFTIEQWKGQIIDNYDYDGYGFWCKDDKQSTDDVFKDRQKDATHVAWYYQADLNAWRRD